ncbi:MAG TPA: hydrogenase formation protein HypD [Acetivibrio sp.]|uniref:hydrogenase formation protein HypD n=1 Tax=Acetivibrio sp. TaxID=1872092 RepID=UPI002C65605B|nr:hydrogenase formation protein HypD [Acetivibrio sp.]HOM01922.1 hydrogenase formation protein HypD [Acetivibrio sp.]
MKTLETIKKELKEYDGKNIKIMEVCGTHTSSIFKNGIRSLLSPRIQLISGPGCPVCVTASSYIDRLVEYSLKDNHCVLTFGDMMKVKGSKLTLTEAKAMGGNVKILYSPLGAIKAAMKNPDTQFVFAAVGFETTIPIYALLIEEIIKNNIKNLRIMTSLKTIIPAISYICVNEKKIDAFLCPGHVSVIIGSSVYSEMASKYRKPFVIGGFEGGHIIAAVYEIVRQISNNEYSMKNMYQSAVSSEGNEKAKALIYKYFEAADDYWRGIGIIEGSGLRLKAEYKDFDAGSTSSEDVDITPAGCKCTDVILGRIAPVECPLFGKACTPLNAVGACMVSSEGACGIWYRNCEV